tara:strand:+ start:1630 stop:1950 length:321 start_codon:yes stop_codon:yes gene_type:complete
MTTQFEEILDKARYVYGIGKETEEAFAVLCIEKIQSTKKGLEFFYGHDLTEEEQKTLIDISNVVICFGDWREDSSCNSQFDEARKAQKNCYEITNLPPQGWYMKKL